MKTISLDNVNELLKSLMLETRRPAKQFGTIMKFYASNGLFDEIGAKEVMDLYEQAADRQAEYSSKGGSHKVDSDPPSAPKDKKTKKTGTHDKPMFVNDYKRAGECCTCGGKIASGNAFRWRQPDGNYNDYHALPSCFPEEHKHLFEHNDLFIKHMK